MNLFRVCDNNVSDGFYNNVPFPICPCRSGAETVSGTEFQNFTRSSTELSKSDQSSKFHQNRRNHHRRFLRLRVFDTIWFVESGLVQFHEQTVVSLAQIFTDPMTVTLPKFFAKPCTPRLCSALVLAGQQSPYPCLLWRSALR